MPRASFHRSSFAGGVWSARAQGKLEDPRYGTAMNVCLNSFPVEEGAWTRRPCWQFMGTSLLGRPGQTIEIPYEFGAKAIMEFTYAASTVLLRLWVPPYNVQGSVTLGDNPYTLYCDAYDTVTAFDTASPAKITTASAHAGWADDDIVVLFNASGDSIACRQCLITKVDSTHFTLRDSVTGFALDGTLPEFTPGVSFVGHVKIFATPYTTLAACKAVNVVPTDGLVFTLHHDHNTYALQVSFDGTGTPTFAYADAAFQLQDGPYLDPLKGTSQQLNSSATATLISGVDYTLVTDTAYWTADDVNRAIRLWNQPAAYAAGTSYAAEAKVSYNGNFWRMGKSSVPAGTAPGQSYATGGVQYLPWVLDPTAGYWTYGAIVSYTNSTTIRVTLSGSPIVNQATIDTWQAGVYCTRIGWPSVGCWHDGRLWLAGALANRVDSTIAGIDATTFSIGNIAQINPTWFSPTDVNGVVLDSSAISERLNAPGQNSVQWMLDDEQGLILGCTHGEYTIRPAPSDDVITPTSIKAKRNTRFGSANVRPAQTSTTAVFVQGNYRKVYEYLTDALSSKRTGRTINEEALHLHVGTIYRLAYMEDPVPLVWALDLGGNLTSCTYRRISNWATEPPKINGWASHEHGGSRLFESLCGATRGGNGVFYQSVAGLSTESITDTSKPRHFVVLTQPNDPGQDIPMNGFFCDEMLSSIYGSDAISGGGTGPDGGIDTDSHGKFYQEFTVNTISSGSSGGQPMGVGVAGYNQTRATGFTLPRTANPGVGAQECVVFAHNGDVWESNSHTSSGAATYSAGDRVAIRVDTINKTIAFRNVTTASAWSSNYTTSGIDSSAGLFVFFCGIGFSGTDDVTLIAPGSESGTIPATFVAWGNIVWSSAVQSYSYSTASLNAVISAVGLRAAIGPGVTTGAPSNIPSPNSVGTNYFNVGIPRVGAPPNDDAWQAGYIGILATGGKASP